MKKGMFKGNSGNLRSHFEIERVWLKYKRSNSTFNFDMLRGIMPKSKASQITIFVIIAIVIVLGIGIYFAVRSQLIFKPQAYPQFEEVHNYYISCAEGIAKTGASILGRQGGYIELPDFEPGSDYSPFSSQLDFLGTAIPYWYYISRNNIAREQVPSQQDIEGQMNDYIKREIANCDFSEFRRAGVEIVLGDAVVDTKIGDSKISAVINQRIEMSFNDTKSTFDSGSIEIDSKLGELYKISKNVYDYENANLFLENYAKDILNLYAPVTGAEISCSPLVWNPYTVFQNLSRALEANMQAIKIKGDYYTLTDPKMGYFVVDANTNIGDNQVKFLSSPDWPSRFEVWPTKDNLMMANPVGTQEGLGAMGFCYVPYKFVYDVYFPVLAQVFSSDGSEIFQFPISVVLNKNNAREPYPSNFEESTESICTRANTNITIYSYDNNLNSVEADIDFRCFNDKCSLGKTKIDNLTNESSLSVMVPQCANGFLTASAEGYKEKKQLISTNEETTADMLLSKEYNLTLEVYVDNALSSEFSVLSISEINFEQNTTEYIRSAAYPYTKSIKLGDGYYRFELKTYKEGALTLPETTKKQCTNVPREGFLGIFGFEDEKCFEITVPSQKLTNLIYAGGSSDEYFTADMLQKAKTLKVYAASVKMPTNLDELQSSFDSIAIKTIEVRLA